VNGKPESPATRQKREKEPAEKPVSLAPLSFEEAVKGLAQARPGKTGKKK
jgi:hypothetical protein